MVQDKSTLTDTTVQETVKSISRSTWLVFCTIYFVVTLSIATAALISADAWVREGLVPLNVERSGDDAKVHYIYPVNTTDALNAFKQTGLDTSFWGHLYQSNLNKDIARSLGVQPDRFWTDGTIRNNALRLVVLDDKYSVLSIRDKVDTNFTTGDEMLEELHAQLQDAESAFRQLEFGNAVYEARLGPLNVGIAADVESSMNISQGGFLGNYVELYQDFSLRFLNEGQRLPGEKEFPFRPGPTRRPFVVIIMIYPFWFGFFGLFFTIPMLTLSPFRCFKTEVSRLEHTRRVRLLFCSVFAVFVILGVATAVVGLQNKPNWFSDTFHLRIVERVSSWFFVTIAVLVHLGFSYLLGRLFVCCCGEGKTNSSDPLNRL